MSPTAGAVGCNLAPLGLVLALARPQFNPRLVLQSRMVDPSFSDHDGAGGINEIISGMEMA
jgi:hypothetical protein